MPQSMEARHVPLQGLHAWGNGVSANFRFLDRHLDGHGSIFCE